MQVQLITTNKNMKKDKLPRMFIVCLYVFVALRPKSTAMVIAGRRMFTTKKRIRLYRRTMPCLYPARHVLLILTRDFLMTKRLINCL